MNPQDATAPPAAAAPRRLLHRALRGAAVLGATVAVCLAGVALTLWLTLRPAAGEWQQRLQWRGLGVDVSLGAALRLATHPLLRPLIDGRTLATPLGHWQWQAAEGGVLHGRCAPCRVRLAALGPQPLVLDEARVAIHRAGAERMHGRLWLGRGSDAIELAWQARLGPQGLQLELALAEVQAARVVSAFAAAVPEAATARIDGRFALKARAQWGAGTPALGHWQIEPRLDGLAVAGLGTESLAGAELPAACGRGVTGAGAGPAAAPIGGWLPRAVVAAEDQRFWEHGGYDLIELAAAFSRNQRRAGEQPDARPHGASTLSQQLAKLLFTGADRSPARKLRELLYAVEMERTLGKGRILQLYLALAPWGAGRCGAAQASLAYLGRDVNTLGPVASAWLASLLTNPAAALARQQARPDAARDEVARIVRGLRPMGRAQRERALAQLASWPLPGTAPPPTALAAPPRRCAASPCRTARVSNAADAVKEAAP